MLVTLPESELQVKIRKPGIKAWMAAYKAAPVLAPDNSQPPETKDAEDLNEDELKVAIKFTLACVVSPPIVYDPPVPEGGYNVDDLPVSDLMYLVQKVSEFTSLEKVKEQLRPTGTPTETSS